MVFQPSIFRCELLVSGSVYFRIECIPRFHFLVRLTKLLHVIQRIVVGVIALTSFRVDLGVQ